MVRKPAVPARAIRKTEAVASPSRRPTVAIQTASDPRQIMREAAWLRMFGSVDAKNPFTR